MRLRGNTRFCGVVVLVFGAGGRLEARGKTPERRLYFNVDLPQKALGRLLQPRAS